VGGRRGNVLVRCAILAANLLRNNRAWLGPSGVPVPAVRWHDNATPLPLDEVMRSGRAELGVLAVGGLRPAVGSDSEPQMAMERALS
jgi:hypothetical protein